MSRTLPSKTTDGQAAAASRAADGAAFPADGLLSFGDCEIDVAAHELRRGGQLVAVAPMVFDLLLFLIAERGRVLSKTALQEGVWRGAAISDNVIARAVMRVRQAIGDNADPPAILRTVHRVGYRFVAQVRTQPPRPEAEAGPGGAPRDTAPRHGVLRVAFLPCESAISDPAHDWVEWGLPGLAEAILAGDERLSLVAPASVRNVLSTLAASLPAAQRAHGVAELLGAKVVVQSALRQAGGQLRLDYQTFGSIEVRGRLRGADAGELGQRLARAIASILFPEEPWPVRSELTDPLAMQAFGRAIEFTMQDNWESGARLLEVVLHLEPGSTSARMQYLRVLASILHPNAFAVGQALLAEADRRGDARLLAATHEALGRAYLNIEGPGHAQLARDHMDQALALAGPFIGEEWVFRIFFGQAVAAHLRRDYPRASHFYKFAWRANELAGSPLRRAAILTNRMLVETNSGSLLLARELAEQAIAICVRHGLQANEVEARAHLARVLSGLGLFSQASEQCESAMHRMSGLPRYEHGCVAWVLLAAGELDVDFQPGGRLARARALAPDLDEDVRERVRAPLDVAMAHGAALSGDVGQVAALMRRVVGATLASGDLEDAHVYWHRWLRLLMRLGRVDQVIDLAQELVALPHYAEDHDLQGTVRHALAAKAHAEGRPDIARASLVEIAGSTPIGAVNARARLDAAWLLLEAGDATTAARLLRDIGPWLQQHPAGLAAAARLQFLQGRHEEALETQRACIAVLESGAPAWFQALLACYAAPAAPAPDLPAAPRLLTLLG